MPDDSLVARCAALLEAEWSRVVQRAQQGALADTIADERVNTAIRRSISSPTKTYRYVLPIHSVRRSKSNAADAASGMVGDVECLDSEGRIVLAIEAKDRSLTIHQVVDKIPGLREAGVTEALFVTSRGVHSGDEAALEQLQQREFVSGHNVYVADLIALASAFFTILGEPGRRMFLQCVCDQLDEHSDVHHRQAWAELLKLA